MQDNNSALVALMKDECSNEIILHSMQEGTLFFELSDSKAVYKNVTDLRKVIVEEQEYLYAYTEKSLTHNCAELGYDLYSQIVLGDTKIKGIIINPESMQYFLERRAIRYFEIFRLVEKAKNEDDLEDAYQRCLLDIRRLWIDNEIEEELGYLNILLNYGFFDKHMDELYYYIAVTFEMLGDVGQAEYFYRNAVKANEDNYWLYYQLGQFYKHIGNEKEELRIYKIAYRYYLYRFGQYRKNAGCDDGIGYIMNALMIRARHDGKKRDYKRYKKQWDELSVKYRMLKPLKIYDMIQLLYSNEALRNDEAENEEQKGK